MDDYLVNKVSKINIFQLNKVRYILHLAGKDMSAKYGLNHWNNSFFKDCIIIILCCLKNEIYIVRNQENVIVATFQIHLINEDLCFEKLATHPLLLGKGIGSFCINEIETIAKNKKCKNVICEVFDKSQHAIDFYQNKGYSIYDTIDTLKYKEYKMKKEL